MNDLLVADRYRCGFTLVEVMVALAIIGLALTGISVTMGGMLDNATSLRDRTYASWIAQNRIVTIRAAGVIPEVGETNGEVEYANNDWEWRAVVSETGVENLLRIDVTVSRTDTGEEIRTVSGFTGEPVVPGQSARVWLNASSGGPAGENDQAVEDDDDNSGDER